MTNLVHIPMSNQAFGRWSATHGFRNPDMAMHFLITGLFGRQVFEPFRLFEGAAGCSIYGYSDLGEKELQDLMRITATPDMPVSPEDIRAKEMPVLEAGQRIGFDLRINPVRRKGNKERDAHDADMKLGKDRDRAGSYLKWLADRFEGVAEIESFRLSKYRKFGASGRPDSRAQPVCGPDATVHGTISIKDRDAFEKLMSAGVGRKKSYGFGMLLLRPADPLVL